MINPADFLGRRFGSFRIEEYLGCGSSGYTFRARHIHIKRWLVTIKVLRPDRVSLAAHNSFLSEATILNDLHHPNILEIYDYNLDSFGRPYLITEYAPGGSLRVLLNRYRSRPVPQEKSLTILDQVGQALSYTHGLNILHHDVKPENILFKENGEAVLGDFGLATYRQPPGTWQAHAAMGTISYMAPEQFEGYISRRSEQYSLGCIAYELFTGRKPFLASDVETLKYLHRCRRPLLLSHINPTIPHHIEQAILRMLEKRRINRFDSVHTAIEALFDPTMTLFNERTITALS